MERIALLIGGKTRSRTNETTVSIEMTSGLSLDAPRGPHPRFPTNGLCLPKLDPTLALDFGPSSGAPSLFGVSFLVKAYTILLTARSITSFPASSGEGP